MNAKLLHVSCSIRWSFLAAAGCFLPHGATALSSAYAPEWGTVMLNAENHSGDAVSVKAKRASLSAFNGVVVPTLGANPTGSSNGRIVYLYAGGYTGDFISIGGGGGGGGGFTPSMGGYGGGVTVIPALSAPSLGSGLATLNPVGSSPAGSSPSAVSPVAIPGSAGAQPGGIASTPGSLVTPLTGPAGIAGGSAVSPVVPAVVAIGVVPANTPSTLVPIPTGVPGTTMPLAVSNPTAGGAVVVSGPAAVGTVAGGAVVGSVPAAVGTVAQGSPFANPVIGTSATAPSGAIVVPDSGGALMLLSLGLATLLAGRWRFAPLH